MATWAYACIPCEERGDVVWYVGAAPAAEWPPETRLVRVRVGSEWACAVIDRSRRVSVEQQLLRDAIPAEEADCPECRRHRRAATAPAAAAVASDAAPPGARGGASGRRVQAAAISMQGRQWVVVLVSMELVRNAGEADMAIEALSPSFGGVPIVLLAQKPDGSPIYYGERTLVELLGGVPLERLPWREHALG